MPLTLAPTFVTCARIAADLALSAEVSARWTDESACSGMTVGGLAHHLQAQTRNMVALLGAPAHDGPPISVLEHYRRADWVHTPLDGEVNTGIAEGSDAEAAAGPAALTAQVGEQLAALPATLEAVSDDRAVLIPWQGWALTAHDFAVTRLMEIVVHADDLAASVDRPTPQFPDEAVREVLALLTAAAVDRHGQTALVRALSRPQRAPASVSAF